MHVKVAGAGPDLVLLHGWGMNARVWDEVATLLAGQFHVHSIDLPAAASVPNALEAMMETIAAATPSRATVCGWSLGGQLALRWAKMKPDQVERLVLIATTPRFVRESGWDYGMEPAVFDAFAHDVARDAAGTLRRFSLLQAHGDTAARNVAHRLRECAAAPSPIDLAGGLHILRDTDLRPDLATIVQPALIMHGERDSVVPPGAGEYLQHTLPRAELEIIAGTAHAPFIAQPRAVAQRIAEFCHG